MKFILYIFLIATIFHGNINGQCTEPDATIWEDTWRSCTPSENPISAYGTGHWIQYNLGSARNLSKTWVWNTNEPGRLNQGFQNVKIDYDECLACQ